MKQNVVFIFTILFFLLGLINITFSLLGLICFTYPLYDYYKNRSRAWCKSICPRKSFFARLFSKVNLGFNPKAIASSKKIKQIVLLYFGVNLFIATMSTIMVLIGRIEPITEVRFMIALPVFKQFYQLIALKSPDFIIHFSYRIYSMMFSSLLVGSLLSFVFRPITWCTICPINTITLSKTK
jgi:hypothetical protein